MDGVAVWSGAAPRTYRRVRRFGGWRTGPRAWASASRRLWRDLLRLARRWLPATRNNAESASAHLPCRWHTGAVLPRERTKVGGCTARCTCGCRHEGAGWGAWWRVLAGRIPPDGGVGV